jgi:membrane-associated protease RseP (regulator of RpoE activity)
LTWVLTIAGFVALIVLHEFGHFIVAKWTGMRVERFFLFFPPKVWSVKRGETEYGIGAIPLGGFVKITGMNPEELEPREPSDKPREAGLLERVESVDQGEGRGVSRPGEPLPPELRERAYYNQPVWKRIVVILAGPVVNILIAFVILWRSTRFRTAPRRRESWSPATGSSPSTVSRPRISISRIASRGSGMRSTNASAPASRRTAAPRPRPSRWWSSATASRCR